MLVFDSLLKCRKNLAAIPQVAAPSPMLIAFVIAKTEREWGFARGIKLSNARVRMKIIEGVKKSSNSLVREEIRNSRAEAYVPPKRVLCECHGLVPAVCQKHAILLFLEKRLHIYKIQASSFHHVDQGLQIFVAVCQ